MPALTTSDCQDYELLDSGGGHKLERFGPVSLIRRGAGRVAASPAGHSLGRRPRRLPTSGQGGRPVGCSPPSPAALGDALPRPALLGAGRRVAPGGCLPGECSPLAVDRRPGADSRPAAARPQPLRLHRPGQPGRGPGPAPRSPTSTLQKGGRFGKERENQALSGLQDRPIRWIVEDTLTYLRREQRRGVRYDGIVLDPPAFGCGPAGEVWTFDRLFDELCQACRAVLSPARRCSWWLRSTPRVSRGRTCTRPSLPC